MVPPDPAANAPLAALGRELAAVALLHGQFTLSSGKTSEVYFDKYLFETRPELLGRVAEHLAALLPADTTRLAGAELGGVPLATAVSLRSGLPFVIVKKAAKAYGTAKLVEGALQPGERIVLLEDVLTTGAQAIHAAQVLANCGATVALVLGVLDREEGAATRMAAAGLPYRVLFTRTQLGF
jgi:orotate phosphoribosyltransferase